jgi:tRNA-dihydrouridine synthase B
MKIGNLDIGNKLFLAPMAEVTDSSFRRIAKENGAGLTFTQMVSALGVIQNEFETLRYLSFNKSEKPIGVQILGSDPGIIAEAVSEISKLKPDLIDLNGGCPVDKVTSYKMGSALLEDTNTIGTIVKRMVDSANGVPISVKVRLGKDRNSINILDNAKEIEANGASLIFVHARTRSDKYEIEADWQWLKLVKENLKIPVVGNGSIFTPSDAKEMMNQTGSDSVMVARGALGNPFIFSRFNSLVEKGIDPGSPNIELVKHTVLKHLEYLEKEYGEILAIDKAKKQAIWYFKDHPGIERFLEKVFTTKNLESLRSLVKEHTEEIIKGSFKTSTLSEINKKFKKKVLFWLTEESIEALG